MANKYSGDGEVVETIYGKSSVYEIIKKSGMFSADFYIYKNGKYHKGSYKDLSRAVEVAKNER